MAALLVRTTDEKLKKALETFFSEREILFAGSRYTVTDVDSMPPLGVPGEITCSYRKNATLRRPFSPIEFEEALKKAGEASTKRLQFAEDGVFLDGEKLALTPIERAILSMLDEADGPLDARAIEARLWQEEALSNRLAVHIASLRAKTERNGRPRLIFTRRSKGYYIDHG